MKDVAYKPRPCGRVIRYSDDFSEFPFLKLLNAQKILLPSFDSHNRDTHIMNTRVDAHKKYSNQKLLA